MSHAFEYLGILKEVLPVFLVIGIGGILRKVNWLTEESDASLMRVAVNVLYPCLIFHSILGNKALDQFHTVAVAPVVGLLTVVLGYVIGYLSAPVLGLKETTARRTFAFTLGIYNFGYVPIPLTLQLFDRETLGVLLVHNLGVEVSIWTFGLMILVGGAAGAWKKLFNPPVIAILLGLVANWAGVTHSTISFGGIDTTIGMLGQCAIPMGLILIGATIADYSHEFSGTGGAPVAAGACLLRLLVLPVLFLLIARYVPFSVELKRVIVLQAAMPTAVFPLVIAKHYNGNMAVAFRVVIWTSIVGLFTIPLWIRFGLWFAGL